MKLMACRRQRARPSSCAGCNGRARWLTQIPSHLVRRPLQHGDDCMCCGAASVTCSRPDIACGRQEGVGPRCWRAASSFEICATMPAPFREACRPTVFHTCQNALAGHRRRARLRAQLRPWNAAGLTDLMMLLNISSTGLPPNQLPST